MTGFIVTLLLLTLTAMFILAGKYRRDIDPKERYTDGPHRQLKHSRSPRKRNPKR
jgi:hypothetical protein